MTRRAAARRRASGHASCRRRQTKPRPQRAASACPTPPANTPALAYSALPGSRRRHAAAAVPAAVARARFLRPRRCRFSPLSRPRKHVAHAKRRHADQRRRIQRRQAPGRRAQRRDRGGRAPVEPGGSCRGAKQRADGDLGPRVEAERDAQPRLLRVVVCCVLCIACSVCARHLHACATGDKCSCRKQEFAQTEPAGLSGKADAAQLKKPAAALKPDKSHQKEPRRHRRRCCRARRCMRSRMVLERQRCIHRQEVEACSGV